MNLQNLFLALVAWVWGHSVPGAITYAAFGGDGFTHIYLRNTNGATTQLTSGPSNDETPEWSFDGTKIAFQRGDANGSGVYTMNADGSSLTRLSPTPGSDALPAFSTDGTKIFFTLVVSPAPSCNGLPTTSIATMNASDGSGRTVIFDGTTAATCFNGQPRESPNGAKISFDCSPFNSGGQICMTNPDGTGLAYLTTTSFTVAADAHWSWDSTRLAISRQDTLGNVNVWTINSDGSGLTQMTTYAKPEEAGDAGWSPDNQQLVFEQDNGGNGQSNPNAPATVSMMNANKTNIVSLGIACSGVGCGPRFAPHGR